MKYYAFTTLEELICIGDFDDISLAMDHEPENTNWVFSENGLRELAKNIQNALEKSK